jgi:hypothetical protein
MTWLFILLLVMIGLFLLLGFLWWGIKKGVMLALNSLVGFFALYAIQSWWLHDLVINLWSVLLTAILGIFGLFLVLLLHALNIAF